jgi:hypothetical protein
LKTLANQRSLSGGKVANRLVMIFHDSGNMMKSSAIVLSRPKKPVIPKICQTLGPRIRDVSLADQIYMEKGKKNKKQNQ